MGIHAELVLGKTQSYVTSYFRSAFRKFEKTSENAACDGFGANFCDVVFCPAQPIVGGLLVA